MRNFLFKNWLIASLAAISAPAFACGTEPFLGEICTVSFNFCPRGYAPADGAQLPISTNNALFALLGTQFGGDGVQTFALPDLRSRSIVGGGMGAGPNLANIAVGTNGGVELVNLTATTDNIPVSGRTKNTTSTAVVTQIGPTSLNVRSPYLGMMTCIALQGIFPSRN
jgi:microcystin-dependent protein